MLKRGREDDDFNFQNAISTSSSRSLWKAISKREGSWLTVIPLKRKGPKPSDASLCLGSHHASLHARENGLQEQIHMPGDGR